MATKNEQQSNNSSVDTKSNQSSNITSQKEQLLNNFLKTTIEKDVEGKKVLVERLKLASQVEHCLLNAYVYMASTIKSTPEEFNEPIDGEENKRSAIQFERAREWKQSILMVAHEEMIHLHYVQCMLRALGERPYFGLPDRDPKTNNWLVPNWKMKIGEELHNDGKGTEVPVESFTLNGIKHFVLYESTDALQNMNPFGEEATALFQGLFDFETRLRIEMMLFNIDDETVHQKLANELYTIYTSLLPVSGKQIRIAAPISLFEEIKIDEYQFQSIAEFYNEGIQPLYDKAFENNWVQFCNRDLINEQLDPNVAAEGFLPIGPIYRGKNFEAFHGKNIKSPYKNAQTVRDIIKEIVEEGEGLTGFKEGAELLLKTVTEIGGEREYIKILLKDINDKRYILPENVQKCETIRKSHLYHFAIVMMSFEQEKKLGEKVQATFEFNRKLVKVDDNTFLQVLCGQLPMYFNACYLVMIMWLSRMYEIEHWNVDKSRRQTIEMIASWPIMSLGIRPFLELISFFPIKKDKLFSLVLENLPVTCMNARLLWHYYTTNERSEKVNELLDWLAVGTLEDIAKWAEKNYAIVKESTISDHTKQVILGRLTGLTVLKEFRPQFEFRINGGYSNILPNLSYQQDFPHSDKYEENPAKTNEYSGASETYQNTLLLRLRFSGWGQVQLATDPDPPTDESGCTGTHMLHASDGKRVLNRALVWQHHANDPTEIFREPAEKLPTVGINCVDISLLSCDKNINIGYVPISSMQSTGAVQTSGTQMKLDIDGINEIWRCTPEDVIDQPGKQIRVDLLDKNGKKPLLLGENHLIWRDGEPIDPFILSIGYDKGDVPNQDTILEFQREVFNQDTPMNHMAPLERLLSCRAPVGFDSFTNIPAWAKVNFSPNEQAMIAQPSYPNNYLQERAQALCSVLKEKLKTSIQELTAKDVTEIVSLAERMKLVSFPRHTTVAWLKYTLHYGHTISGNIQNGENKLIVKALSKQTGLTCDIATDTKRENINSRWVIKYCLGIMDTDALSNFVFGELYIPLQISVAGQEIKFSRDWTYTLDLSEVISKFACDFKNPFWRNDYEIENNVRILTLETDEEDANKKKKVIRLIETLTNSSPSGYAYRQEGFDDINNCNQAIKVEYANENTKFTWSITFTPKSTEALVNMTNFFGQQNALVNDALEKAFTPSTIGP